MSGLGVPVSVSGPFVPRLVTANATVAVNAPSPNEAVAKVREALRRWGEIALEVVAEEPI